MGGFVFSLVVFFGVGYAIWQLIKYLLSRLRRTITRTHWTNIDRKEIVFSLIAVCVVVSIEFTFPSFGKTSKNPHDDKLLSLIIAAIPWPDRQITAKEFSNLAPWLKTTGEKLLKNQNVLAYKELLASQLELSIAKEKFELAKVENRIKTFGKHSEFVYSQTTPDQTLPERKIALGRSITYRNQKLTEKQNEIQTIKADDKHHLGTLELPEFPAQIEVFSTVKKISNIDIAAVQSRRGIDPFFKQLSSYLTKDVRLKQTAWKNLSCRIVISETNTKTIKAQRLCELIVPLGLNYDIVNPNCGPPSKISKKFRFTSNLSKKVPSACIEKWVYPHLRIIASQTGIRVFPPRRIDFYGPVTRQEDLPISTWQIKLPTGTRQLDKPQNFSWDEVAKYKLKEITLIHLPAHNKPGTRIWQNFDIDAGFFESQLKMLSGPEYGGSRSTLIKEDHTFSTVQITAKITSDLELISSFTNTQKTDRSTTTKSFATALSSYHHALRVFINSRPLNFCSFKRKFSPGAVEKAIAQADYPQLKSTFLKDGVIRRSTVLHCERAVTALATIESINDYFGFPKLQ